MITRRSGRGRVGGNGGRGERGFSLIEVMMAVALLGVTTGVITQVFLGGWRLWKFNYDSLLLQRKVRMAMGVMTMALREAKPFTVIISTPAAPNSPKFSEITFTDGRGRGWIFRQTGRQIYGVVPPSPGSTPPPGFTGSSTTMMGSDIDALTFTYPSFQDMTLIEIAITARKMPWANAAKPIVVQLVERTLIRNP